MKCPKAAIVILIALGLTNSVLASSNIAQHRVTVRFMPSTELLLAAANHPETPDPKPEVMSDTTMPAPPNLQSRPNLWLNWRSKLSDRCASKITAQLRRDIESEIHFEAALARPAGSSSTSIGYQELGFDAADMLIGIESEECVRAGIMYSSRSSGMGEMHLTEPITVVWTITDVGGSDYDVAGCHAEARYGR